MSIDLPKVTALSDKYGAIAQLELGGKVIWSAVKSIPAVLPVEKITSDTYAGSTTYTGESFVLLDIYPKSASSTVKVTYGGLTKTLAFTGTNAQKVYFGTFNGVSDSVTTPASGTLTIEGDYIGFASGTYSKYNSTTAKSQTAYSSCVTSVVDWGATENIYSYGFYNCAKLTAPPLPSGIASIPAYAFYGCSNLALASLPSAITSIGEYAFYECAKLNISEIPNGVTTIGAYAFAIGKYDEAAAGTAMFDGSITLPSTIRSIGNYAFACAASVYTTFGNIHPCYLSKVRCLATTPPTLTVTTTGGEGESAFGHLHTSRLTQIQVLSGCGEAYKAATGWSRYSSIIVEGA